MFKHHNCGGFVFPLQRIEIRCGMNLTAKGIQIAGVSKISRINKENRVIFSCDKCENNVPVNEIEIQCMQCLETFSSNELFVLYEEGGQYCANCCNEYFPESKRVPAINCLAKLAQ